MKFLILMAFALLFYQNCGNFSSINDSNSTNLPEEIASINDPEESTPPEPDTSLPDAPDVPDMPDHCCPVRGIA